MKKLAERGKSWKIDDWDTGELLAALFCSSRIQRGLSAGTA